MFPIDCTWIGLLLPCKDHFRPQCRLSFYLCPHQPVSFFLLKISMTLVSYFLDFILPKEETNYQSCMVIIQIIKTLILAKASVQEFSGLHNFEEVNEVMNCKCVLRSGALFSNTQIWIWLQSFFKTFSLISNTKKEVIEQLYHWAMTSITQPVTRELFL